MKRAELVVGEEYAWRADESSRWAKVIFVRPAESRMKVFVKRDGGSERELEVSTGRLMCRWADRVTLERDLDKFAEVEKQNLEVNGDEKHSAMLVMHHVAKRADLYNVWQFSAEDMDRLWTLPGSWKRQRGLYVDFRTGQVRVPAAVAIRMAAAAVAADPDLVVEIEKQFKDSPYRAGMGDGRLDRWLSILRSWASSESELGVENARLRQALLDTRTALREMKVKLVQAERHTDEILAQLDGFLTT